MPDVVVRSLDEMTPRQLHDLLKLRIDVFVVEQECAYPELDGRDPAPGTRHLWIEQDGAILTALRILDDGAAWRIGRVVTRADARGAGLSAALLQAALERCAGRPVVLDAQARLEPWYARFGFEPAGPQFDEDGIAHVPMRRPAR